LVAAVEGHSSELADLVLGMSPEDWATDGAAEEECAARLNGVIDDLGCLIESGPGQDSAAERLCKRFDTVIAELRKPDLSIAPGHASNRDAGA
jgi:hypothetical protein